MSSRQNSVGLVAVACMVLVACANQTQASQGRTVPPSATQPLAASTNEAVQACSIGNVETTLTPGQIRVTPLHSEPCRFSGRYPVWIITGKHKGTPPNATGELIAGHAYVQTYDPTEPVACPAPGPGSPSTVTVELEGQQVDVAVGIDSAHGIGCVTLRAGDSNIE